MTDSLGVPGADEKPLGAATILNILRDEDPEDALCNAAGDAHWIVTREPHRRLTLTVADVRALCELAASRAVGAGDEGEKEEYRYAHPRSGPVHGWFGLTYSSYLVLPRALMQEMPIAWQHRMVACLKEIAAEFEQENDNYTVLLRGKNGRMVHDPFSQYRHPEQWAVDEARARAKGTFAPEEPR